MYVRTWTEVQEKSRKKEAVAHLASLEVLAQLLAVQLLSNFPAQYPNQPATD